MLTGQPVYAAAVCAGAAAWLFADRGPGSRRARLVFAGPGAGAEAGSAVGPPAPWSWRRWWPVLRLRREWLCLVVGGLVALLGESVLPLFIGGAAVPLVRRRLVAGERRRARDRRAEAVIALCGAVVGELRAGWQPGQALRFAAGATGALGGEEAAVFAAVRFGGDVPEALRRAAGEEGADGLAGMAACWQVAVDGGAGLAAGLDRLEAALRERRDQRERLRAQLAGAWVTVGMLALLPVVGLAMGWALGADPLRVLLHTPAGAVCLLVGGLLEGAGLWWAGRIVRAGEEP
ncbi:type II secretion system F family protein [Streptomyces sp. NPDC006368]|uniref:type II secretion system F family protein n=1 Tax=Streptomyces sp. NPDC006368 TaxID=3156760 RepID=UPI0033B401DA